MSNARPPIEDAVSAGGVVWRRVPAGALEVVLCGRHSDSVWGLPKGTPDKGETIEETALREVREETGLLVEIGPRLGTIEYWFTASGRRYHKHVHHWLMSPVGGDLADHDYEFDEVAWVPIIEAKQRVTYPNERRILAEAEDALTEVPSAE